MNKKLFEAVYNESYDVSQVEGLAKYSKDIASAVLDGKLYDSNAVLAICSMLHCNEDYAAECLDAWIETEQIRRSHKQEGLFKKILNEAKSLSFSMESLALALEDIMPFAHPKCKLIKAFGKKQMLTEYMPCFDYFGNDSSDTDNSFMVSLYHGAHQRLYIFNDDEMTEWNIEIDNKSVATVGYNDVNALAHTIKELLYMNWPEKMKEAEDFVEEKWEEGKRNAQEYIEMIDRHLADCNNDWSEYGRKNAGNDADWFVNKIKKNYSNAEKIISLCDKFMPTIKFTESKRMKELKKQLFEKVIHMKEVSVNQLATAIAKRFGQYDGTDAGAKELGRFIQMNLGTAVGTGTSGIVDDTNTQLYGNCTPENKACALACIRSKNPQAARQFFARYGKGLGIDVAQVEKAIEIASKDQNVSLSAAQQQAAA